MLRYEIKDVVCDYGLYEDGELILILNSAHNAHLVKRILEIDQSVPNVATPADMVEVVRCKDCRSWEEVGVDPITSYRFGYCRHYQWQDVEDWEKETNDNDFCSYGERKENGKM